MLKAGTDTTTTTMTVNTTDGTTTMSDKDITMTGKDFQSVKMSCLVVVIIGCVVCNSCAIWFINMTRRQRSLKDKIVTLLCSINICQTITYSIELHAAVKNKIGGVACQVAATSICILTYTSIGCFVTLTVERYLAINKPFQYVTWFSDGHNNTWWLTGPPVFGILLAIAPLLGWSRYEKGREFATYCCLRLDTSVEARSYFLTVCLLVFVVPITFTAFCFYRILSEVRETAHVMKQRYGRGSSLSRRGRTIVKEQWLSCALTGVVYLGSWVPYSYVCFRLCFDLEVSVVSEYVSIFLSKSSTISSPIIYCLVERRFRSFIKERLSIQLQPMLFGLNRKESRVTKPTQRTDVNGNKKLGSAAELPFH